MVGFCRPLNLLDHYHNGAIIIIYFLLCNIDQVSEHGELRIYVETSMSNAS